MTARAIAAEAKNEIYEGRIKDLYTTIDAQKGHIKLAEKQLEKQTANRADAGQIFNLEGERLADCRQQLLKADVEIARLRNPPFLKRMFSSESIIGFGTGYGVGSLKK